jgi:hypothetical protein
MDYVGFYFIAIFIGSVSLLFLLSYMNKFIIILKLQSAPNIVSVKDKKSDAHGNCGEKEMHTGCQ